MSDKDKIDFVRMLDAASDECQPGKKSRDERRGTWDEGLER